MTTTTHADEQPGDDLTERRRKVRQQEILILLAQWGPGYQRITGDGVRYVAEIAHATAEEWQWIAEHVQAHPEVWDTPPLGHDEGFRVREERGRAAFAAAETAFNDGDHAAARDHLDEAFAYGEITEDEWRRLHDHISTTDAPHPAATPTPTGQV